MIAAGIGGAVEGAVFASTFEPRFASMAGSAAESAVNEAGDYLSGKKELTWENVGDSALNIGKDVAVDAAAGWVTEKVGLDYKPYKINEGWFQPKSLSLIHISIVTELASRIAVFTHEQTMHVRIIAAD